MFQIVEPAPFNHSTKTRLATSSLKADAILTNASFADKRYLSKNPFLSIKRSKKAQPSIKRETTPSKSID
jgi:hypothetical protein